MKRVILDHFRRWWWVWLIGCILHAVISGFLCSPDEPYYQATAAFPVGVFLGTFLLMFDVQRGHTRALLATPVTAGQVARAWWWVAVGIPAVAFAVISGIAFGVLFLKAFVFHGKMPVIEIAANNWLANLFLLGVTFFAATGLPARGNAGSGWMQQARGLFFGALYGGSIGGWMFYKDLNFGTPAGVMVFSAAAIMTVLGWFAAETMVMERAGLRSSSPAPGKKSSSASRCAEGHGGMLFMAQAIFTRMSLMGLAMVLFISIYALMIAPKFAGLAVESKGGVNADPMNVFGGISVFVFQFMWIMSFQVVAFALNIRFLRTLPVSAAKLAGVLVFTPLAAMLVVWYLSNVFLAAVSHAPPTTLEKMTQSGGLLQIAVATIMPPILVWRGMGVFAYLVMFLLMCAGMFSSIQLRGQIPFLISTILPPLIVLGTFVVTKFLLERSSKAYRPRANQFAGWNWGGGR